MSEEKKPNSRKTARELHFSSLYTAEQAQRYFHKHQESLSRRLSDQQEKRMARKALRIAGDPNTVLDLPCGAGRFWSLLAEKRGRRLIAADYSRGMLQVARDFQPESLLQRVELLQTSAFHLALADATVDSIFCMRLFHHIGKREDRMRILREFHRVTRETVCLSLWIDSYWQGRRRRRLEYRREQGLKPYRRGYQDRFVLSPTTVEEEFASTGFQVIGKVDLLPLWSIWRTYVLRKSN